MTGPRRDELERFMSHVNVSDCGCWLWTAYRMKNGYGLFRYPDGHHLAHRVSHRLFIGPVPDGLDVMHSCDNPACVNPEHLSAGTRTDNMRDAVRKGRMRRGESHGRAKLVDADVIAIRESSELQRVLALRYGVRQTTISKIKRGQKWSHLSLGA